MSTFISALWITLIGMGLVFIALLLLWALMEYTVKGTSWYNKRHPEQEEEVIEEAEVSPVALPAPPALKLQAAAAAVAVALALQDETSGPEISVMQPAAYAGQPSAWQAKFRRASRYSLNFFVHPRRRPGKN